MKYLASQIFTGDDIFPFEIGTELEIPGGGKGVVVMGSSKHESEILGEHFLLRIVPIAEGEEFNEDDFEIFTWAHGHFLT